jgi:hypothetical protein
LECEPVSVNHVDSSKPLQIFPNPFKNNLEIANATGNEHYVLSNLLGEIVWQGKHIENEDFAQLSAGIYTLSISNSIRNQAFKLIKE